MIKGVTKMAVSTETLLDKLYNLRGEDSDILKEMNAQKNKAEETKKRTTEQKAVLQNNIADLKKLREELEEQGEKFKEMLQGINREDYNTVLTRLRIDFDPKNLLEKLNRNLPRTIETVELDTKKSEEELVKVEEEMNHAITTIEELGIRKDTALANQEKLNDYIELALTGRINITRDSITSLLEEFSFSEEEQREAAKILMFPEDALYAYDKKIQQRDKSGKSISQVIQEAKIMSTEPMAEEKISSDVTYPEVSKEDTKKEDLIYLLKENGLDYLDFTSEELDDLIYNYNHDLMEKNLKLMKDNKLNPDIFISHSSMLYDDDLGEKLQYLFELGKEPVDIYLNPNILVKYDINKLKANVELLVSNGMDPKSVPLMAY